EPLGDRPPGAGRRRRGSHRQHRRPGVADQLPGAARRRHSSGDRQHHQHRGPGHRGHRIGERLPAGADGAGPAARAAGGGRRARRGRGCGAAPAHPVRRLRTDRPVADRRRLTCDPDRPATTRARRGGGAGPRRPATPRPLVAARRGLPHLDLRRLLRRRGRRAHAGPVPAHHRRGTPAQQRDAQRHPRGGQQRRGDRLRPLRLDRLVGRAAAGTGAVPRLAARPAHRAAGSPDGAAPDHRPRRPGSRDLPRDRGLPL
ncbi:MAG: Uncharacterized UPF0721 integral membrane protein, partial [uncultured Blastococcus sp.]